MKRLLLLLVTVAILATFLLSNSSDSSALSTIREEVGYLLGEEEYVYGFPLVMMDVTREVLTATQKSSEYKAPINQFGRLRTYVNPDFKDVVRISVNSLWSHGFLDLDKEPMIVTIPDTGNRYVVVQAMNMWTDDFASAGTRTPENKSGDFLIAGPKWNGTAPAGIKETFRSSTRYAWVLVQISADSPKDFPAIHALQDQLKITPLSGWGKPYTSPETVPVDPGVDLTATPFDQVRLMTGEMFFKRLAKLLKDNPPYAADSRMVEKLKLLGIEAGEDLDPDKLDPKVRKGINEAPWNVWKLLAQGPYTMPTTNGWIDIMNVGNFGTDYQTRAFIAFAGLGALTSKDCVYPCAFVDGDGQALDAAYNYLMHFPKDGLPPSASGVWSISQYRDNFYVRNVLDRYGILSSMPLRYNADGSLDIYIQAKSPGPDKETNWLPTPPSGMFNLTVRVYQPKNGILDGTYKLPPVKKVR
jgi:hypothetical protein